VRKSLALMILLIALSGVSCTGSPSVPSVTTPAATSPVQTSSISSTPLSTSLTSTPGPPPGAVSADSVNGVNITFPGTTVTIKAYQAWPKAGGPFPALIVIHENRGLTEHIKDVTRRIANQGYLALGVDLLSRVGGRDAFLTDEAATTAINQLSAEGVMQDLNSAVTYIKGLPDFNKNRLGVIGYCWGGGNSLLFATRSRDLQAAVVYYGPNPSNIDEVANITAPVLGIYGQDDTRITVNVLALDTAIKKYAKSFEYKIYPGAAHAFFNDTGTRYHPESASDSWKVTLAFLQKYLLS
jgi:carboxymethylenebutenolidase